MAGRSVPDGFDERLREVETWQASHESECIGRHRAIEIRMDSQNRLLLAAVLFLSLMILGAQSPLVQAFLHRLGLG